MSSVLQQAQREGIVRLSPSRKQFRRGFTRGVLYQVNTMIARLEAGARDHDAEWLRAEIERLHRFRAFYLDEDKALNT